MEPVPVTLSKTHSISYIFIEELILMFILQVDCLSCIA